MKKFEINKILVPVDFSEYSNIAIEHAKQMAKISNASIELINVVEAFNLSVALNYFDSKPNYVGSTETQAEEKLKQLKEKIEKESGLKVTWHVAAGAIHTQIVKVAQETEADIIIIGSSGVRGFQEFIMGSNTGKIVSETPCPVLSVYKKSRSVNYKTIIMPVDHTLNSRRKVPYVEQLAKTYNSLIRVVALNTVSAKDEIDKLKFVIQQVTRYLDRKRVKYETDFENGDNTATMLLDYAKKNNGDLIVIMTEHELDHAGLFMGPFAQQVVNNSPIPVLSIRHRVSYKTFEPNPY